MRTEEVAIIGAGPSGLSAALQLKRYGITPLVLERDEMGGLLRNANLVENYPGFPGGVPGPKLAALFKEQASQAGVMIIQEEVTSVARDGEAFKVQTPSFSFRAKIVVAASGTIPRKFKDLRIPSSLDKQVFYEVFPLLDQRRQRIAIVGAGDAAFDYALNLARCNQVFILNRQDQVKCLPLLWERAQTCEKITYNPMTEIHIAQPDPQGNILLNCTGPKGEYSLTVNYLIGALGRDPCIDFLRPELRQEKNGGSDPGGLYWIGDVKNGLYRQTSIAVGDGTRAAMSIYQHLKGN